MKWFLIAIIVIAIAGLLFARAAAKHPEKQAVVSVGAQKYHVDIADNVIKTARGLSGRSSMRQDQGMLFIFSSAEPRYFWMNEMLFPLDVIWIRDGKVVGLQENIPHPAANDGKTERFQSEVPADMVLELNAGQIAKQGIKVGDTVTVTR